MKEEKEKKKPNKSCPICGKHPQNPAFIRASGYVFCYSCIHSYVENERMCPITKIPIDSDSIQIIYD